MKRPQDKFHADTKTDSKVIRSKKTKFMVRSKFVGAQFFLLIDILLKLKQQMLTYCCKFSWNSDTILDFLRLL